jgi:hypothetical protein
VGHKLEEPTPSYGEPLTGDRRHSAREPPLPSVVFGRHRPPNRCGARPDRWDGDRGDLGDLDRESASSCAFWSATENLEFFSRRPTRPSVAGEDFSLDPPPTPEDPSKWLFENSEQSDSDADANENVFERDIGE